MKDAARIAGLADGVRLMNRHAATALLYATEVLDDAPETNFFGADFRGTPTDRIGGRRRKGLVETRL